MAKLVIDVDVDDKGNVKLQGIKGNVNDLDGTLKNLNSTANMVRNAFMGLIAVLGIKELEHAAEAWIKLSMAQEKADNALKIAMLNNRAFSQEFLKSTMDQAMALQRLTGINRTTIEEGQKLLMTYRRISTEELPRATQAMANMAARTGDTFFAAKALGEASQGSGRYLRTLGIAVDDEILKHKNFEEVLVILEKMLKDQASVLGMGYNKWNILGAQLDEMRKRAGDLFNEFASKSGILDNVAGGFDKIIDKLIEFKTSGDFTDFLKGLSPLVNFLENLVHLTEKLISLLPKLAPFTRLGVNNFAPTREQDNADILKFANERESVYKRQLAELMSSKTGPYKLSPDVSAISFTGWGNPVPTSPENFEKMRQDAIIKIQNNLAYIDQLKKGGDAIKKSVFNLAIQKMEWSNTMSSPLAQTAMDMGVGNLKDWNKLLSPQGEWQTPNPIVGPSEDELKDQESAAKKAAEALLNLREETARIKAENKDSFTSDWELLNLDYEKQSEKVTDKIALYEYYNARFDQIKDKEEARQNKAIDIQLSIDKIDHDLFEARIKFREQYEATIKKLDEQHLTREKQAADEDKKIAVGIFDEKMNNINPIFNQGEIDKYLNIAKQSMMVSKDAQIKIVNQQYIEQLKIIEENIFDIDESQKQIINANQERANSLKAIDNDWLKEQKDIIKKANEMWINLSEDIADSLGNALKGMMSGQRGILDTLAKGIQETISSTMTNSFKQSYIKPFTDQIMAGMRGDLVPFGSIASPGQIVAPSWMGNNPNQMSQYIGVGLIAGSTAYGIGSSGYQSGLNGGNPSRLAFGGAIAGATSGMAVGGPWGAVLGAGAGGGLEYFSAEFGKQSAENKAKKEALRNNISGFWEVAGNEVKLISNDWQNKHPEVEAVIKEAVQSQINFYQMAGQIFGKAIGNFSSSYSGAYTSINSVSGIPGLVANFDSIKSIGSGAVSEAEEAFKKSFTVDWGSRSFRSTFENTINEGWDILKNSSSETRKADFEKWFNSKSMHKDNVGWMSPSEFATSNTSLEAFMTKYQEELQKVVDFFAGNVSNALADGINSTGDKLGTFYDSLRKNLAVTVGESLKQGFVMNDIMPILMKSFGEITDASGNIRPSLTNLLTDYSSGKTSLTDVNAYIVQMGADFNDNLKLMEPLFNGLVTVLDSVNQALGTNTSAIQISTETLKSYSDSVDAFLYGLAGGSLAPYQSSASMMEQYNTLYGQALLDPSKFSTLSGYTGGSYLPWLQGTSSDYAGNYASTVSQIAGLKTAWGSPIDDSINPADYAIPTVAGQTQGIGFKQMFKEALQEVVAEKLAAMLKDIADAAREEKELTGSIEITGNIGGLMCKSITSDADTRQVVHNA